MNIGSTGILGRHPHGGNRDGNGVGNGQIEQQNCEIVDEEERPGFTHPADETRIARVSGARRTHSGLFLGDRRADFQWHTLQFEQTARSVLPLPEQYTQALYTQFTSSLLCSRPMLTADLVAPS